MISTLETKGCPVPDIGDRKRVAGLLGDRYFTRFEMVRVMDKNLDWKLLCFNIAKNPNAAFLLRNKKKEEEGNVGRPSLTIHGAS